jgi:hypothetical protein
MTNMPELEDPGPEWSEVRDGAHEREKLLDSLSIEQLRFLSSFSRDYVAGRRLLCVAARAVVGLGVVGGAVAAIAAGVHAALGLKLW